MAGLIWNYPTKYHRITIKNPIPSMGLGSSLFTEDSQTMKFLPMILATLQNFAVILAYRRHHIANRRT